MLGSYVSAAYQSTPAPEAARFFRALLTWAGVMLPIEVSGSAIEARHLESGGDALLFLFNHDKEPTRSKVSLRRPAGEYVASDLIEQRPVTLERGAEGVTVTVGLPPGDVRVLRIARR
jgi:hypothetical protein